MVRVRRERRELRANHALCRCIELAKRYDLFVLDASAECANKLVGCKWVFYDRISGGELLSYWPHTGLWQGGGMEGEALDMDEAVAVAAARRKAR